MAKKPSRGIKKPCFECMEMGWENIANCDDKDSADCHWLRNGKTWEDCVVGRCNGYYKDYIEWCNYNDPQSRNERIAKEHKKMLALLKNICKAWNEGGYSAAIEDIDNFIKKRERSSENES